jgi:hypothetical protein
VNRDLRRSRAQERATAKAHGGSTVPASGALPGRKGDVSTEHNLIECKRTDKRQITIHETWLDKIRMEALVEGRTGLLVIEMASGRRWVIVEEPDWIEREEFFQRDRGRGMGDHR